MRNILFLILYFSLSTQAQVVEVVGSMIEDLKSEEQKLNLIMSSDTSLVARHYEMACLFSLKAEYEKAFEHLTKAISYGLRGEDALTDTDLNPLRKDSLAWLKIDALLNAQYIARNSSITKPQLGIVLWRLGIEDQRYRSLNKNNKAKIIPLNVHDTVLSRISQLNLIIKKHGWPAYSEVGIEAADAVFLIYQHSDARTMKRVLPIFIQKAKEGDADCKKAAMMIDRYLAYKEGVQIYGTQSFRKRALGSEVSEEELRVYPIVEIQDLDTRRKVLGMKAWEESCLERGIKCDQEISSKNSRIKMKKRWVRKGFLIQ
jgi:hypothetical protein